MTEAKYPDSLYSYLHNSVSKALSLEYGIRASKQINEQEMNELKEWEVLLREYWHAAGASEDEILDSNLLQYAWDLIQFGYPLGETHGKWLHPEIAALRAKALYELPGAYIEQRHLLNIPAARFFRIADLMAGADIDSMIKTVVDKLGAVRKLEKKSVTSLDQYSGITFRAPVTVHPAFHQSGTLRNGRPSVSISVELDGDLDEADWERAFKNFQYRYAVLREGALGQIERGSVTRKLIQSFLEWDYKGANYEYPITNHKQIVPSLIGLKVWDLRNVDKEKVVDAVSAGAQLYNPNDPMSSESNIQDMYKLASKRINAKINKFRTAHLKYTGKKLE